RRPACTRARGRRFPDGLRNTQSTPVRLGCRGSGRGSLRLLVLQHAAGLRRTGTCRRRRRTGGALPEGEGRGGRAARALGATADRKSTRLNSSHVSISYAVFCLKKKKKAVT